ncbi:hypothetical protein [Candidatus Mycoplasma haematohominis]|uniref:hypothetical protein n=1 Tax=Candidatus Mycoplasma haematohominis TaxID=1494318 RepID=UPI001C0A6F93|nr:hypothetical protein [Candidatus Mycoplasma haemohominis]
MASQAAIAGAGVLGAGALGAGSVGTYYAVYGTSDSENVTVPTKNDQAEDLESEQNARQEPSTVVPPTGETEASSQLSADAREKSNLEDQSEGSVVSVPLSEDSSVGLKPDSEEISLQSGNEGHIRAPLVASTLETQQTKENPSVVQK